VDKTGCFSLCGITYEAGTALIRKKVDVRFDPFDLSVVEVWHAGTKQLDARPLVIGEFVASSQVQKAAVEIGRSRLLDVLTADNEKRKNSIVALLDFGKEGSHNGH